MDGIRELELENIEAVKVLYGELNSNLKEIENEFDISIHTRGNKIALKGDEKRTAEAGMLMEHPGIDTTMIRFSGLIGYDRAPIKSIKRKKLVLNPDCPLNLIHRDDCVGDEKRLDKSLVSRTGST